MDKREIYRKELKEKFKKLSDSQKEILFFRLALRTLVGLQYSGVSSEEESKKSFYVVFVRIFLAFLRNSKSFEDFAFSKSSKLLISAATVTTYSSDYYLDVADDFDIAAAAAAAVAAAAYSTAYSVAYTDAYAASDASTAAATAVTYAYDAYAPFLADFKNAGSFEKIFKDSLENDLAYLLQNSEENLKNEKLFFENIVNFRTFTQPLETINPAYGFVVEHLIKPAMKGELFKNKVLLNALESLDDLDKFENNAVALCNYLDGKKTASKTCRVILLGSGGAGKTSLVNNLFKLDSASKEEKPTPKIKIREKFTKTDKTQMSFWDFGGQVIMHSTHTFFLSEQSVYVVVCNARLDEQPDSWLDVIQTKLKKPEDKSTKHHVFIVFTYSDTEDELKNEFLKRENRLKRVYGTYFNFSFHFLSNTKLKNKEHKKAFENFESKLEEKAVEIGKIKTLAVYKDIYEQVITRDKSVYRAEELDKYLSEKSPLALVDNLEEMIRYGYIFCVNREYKKSEKLKQERFIVQKHWLTYGVYSLINADKTKENFGLITRADFDKILYVGEKQYIDETGEIDTKKCSWCEEILYDKEGVEILYEVVQNYKWAIQSNSTFEQLIFPNALRLDEPNNLEHYIVNDESKLLKLVVEFKIMPKDFFFRFVALGEKHIDSKFLWRSGAVMFDGLDKHTFALVMVEASSIHINVSGNYKEMLMNFLSNYLVMTLRGYENLDVRILQGVLNGKSFEMVDTKLMSILDNKADADAFSKKIGEKMKEGNVTYNINNYGNMQMGDGNTMHIKNISNDVDKLVELLKAENNDNLEKIITKGEALQKMGADSPKFYDEAVKFADDVSKMDSLINLAFTHGITLMTLAPSLMGLLPT